MILQLFFNVSLALGGGGAYGLSEIGVLGALENENINIEYITGTSMGAIIGGLYAAGYSPAEIESIAVSTDWNKLFSIQRNPLPQFTTRTPFPEISGLNLSMNGLKPILPKGINNGMGIENLLGMLFMEGQIKSNGNFDSLMIPFRCPATEIKRDSLKVFKDGQISVASRASMGIPGIFSPVIIGDSIYLDGGILDNVPVDLLPDSSLKIAAFIQKRELPEIKNIWDIISQSTILLYNTVMKSFVSSADIKIPIFVGETVNFSFSKVKKYISEGKRYTEMKIPEIKKAVLSKKVIKDFDIEEKRGKFRKTHPYYIKSINFYGTNINPNLILKKKYLKEGDTLSPKKVYNFVQELYKTGFFESINSSVYRGNPKSDSVNLHFNVKETPPAFINTGLMVDNLGQEQFSFIYGVRQINKYYADFTFGGGYGNKKMLYASASLENLTPINITLSLILHYSNDLILYDTTSITHYGGVIQSSIFDAENGKLSLGLGIENVMYDYIKLQYFKSPRSKNCFERDGFFYNISLDHSIPKISNFDYITGDINLNFYKNLMNRYKLYIGSELYLKDGNCPKFKEKLIGDVDILPIFPFYNAPVKNFATLKIYNRFRIFTFDAFGMKMDIYFSPHLDLGIINNNYKDVKIFISPFMEFSPIPLRIGYLYKNNQFYISFGKKFN